ncbi:EscU/YscU/HrcU family type III secretion system export apparatus switch protein [Treponema sp.]|uniref:EscU/YscU/HrcU family type III secretion system export apparatus switch protein n=1 Tax=Treponema sp. TaxID=166 RepID=UPI003EFF4944
MDLQWFAAEDEGRTEEASQLKLQKARKEGRVAKSQELNGAVVFLFVTFMLIVLAPWFYKKICTMMIFYFSNVTSSGISDFRLFYVFVTNLLSILLPLSISGIFAGVIINLVQNRGFIFTTKTIEPKFSKIVPKFGEYFRKTLFSMMGLFNIAKSIVKLAIILVVAFFFIRSDLATTLMFLKAGGVDLALSAVGGMVAKLLVVSALILIAIAVVDYVMQRREFKEQMKMTKKEVKEEFKESEGDPEFKGRLESAQKEMLSHNMPKAVRESDVVITNPTHYAVSLQWKQNEQDAPMVTAKGTDNTAQTIKRIAAENDVPVIENRSLARGLYAETEVGDIIPSSYLRAIAAVYVQVGYMNKEKH